MAVRNAGQIGLDLSLHICFREESCINTICSDYINTKELMQSIEFAHHMICSHVSMKNHSKHCIFGYVHYVHVCTNITNDNTLSRNCSLFTNHVILYYRPCGKKNKISLGGCGRFTVAEFFSFGVSLLIVFIWIMTGHWLLMDAMGIGLCVAFIAFVRLPSLKVSTLLLSGLLLYDVFWVFFSKYVFSANVMVRVGEAPILR